MDSVDRSGSSNNISEGSSNVGKTPSPVQSGQMDGAHTVKQEGTTSSQKTESAALEALKPTETPTQPSPVTERNVREAGHDTKTAAVQARNIPVSTFKPGPLPPTEFNNQYRSLPGFCENLTTTGANIVLKDENAGTYLLKPSSSKEKGRFVLVLLYKSVDKDKDGNAIIKTIPLDNVQNLQEVLDGIEAKKDVLRQPVVRSKPKKPEPPPVFLDTMSMRLDPKDFAHEMLKQASAKTNHSSEFIGQIFQRYPNILGKWPESVRERVLPVLQKTPLDASKLENVSDGSDSNEVAMWAYRALVTSHGFEYSPFDEGGYHFVTHPELLPANRKEPSQFADWDEQAKTLAVQNYKIHLMPKQEDIPLVTVRLLEKISTDPVFAASLDKLKIKTRYATTSTGQEMPILVVYPKTGKQNAQTVLNTVSSLVSDLHGLDRTPRYNQKVTDFVYYAQGDADKKNEASSKDWFEPDMVHFKSDFVTSGEHQDYKLEPPPQ